MFTSATHFLTIAALIWHVLIGCCAHLPHEISSSVEAVQGDDHSSVFPKVQQTMRSQCHCAHHGKHRALEVKSKVTERSGVVNEGLNHSRFPHEDHNGCTHGRCVFLSDGSEIAIHPIETVQMYLGKSQLVTVFAVPAYQFAIPTSRCVAHRISCDLLQSWQI